MKYLFAVIIAGALALGVQGAEAKPTLHGNQCVQFYKMLGFRGQDLAGKLRNHCALPSPAWADSTVVPPIDREH